MPQPHSFTAQSRALQNAQQIWLAGIDAVDAGKLVGEFVTVTPDHLHLGSLQLNLDTIDRIVVVGTGKSSAFMAAGLEEAIGRELAVKKQLTGRVNVPDDQTAATRFIDIIGCRPAGINLPTQRVLDSTKQITNLLASLKPRDLCICLISGGGSALLEQPVAHVSLEDFGCVTRLLSHQGAPIEELNLVRQQLSRVKAGGLTRFANAKTMVSLILSDVLGDRLDMIASGPTVQPKTKWRNRNQLALDVLKKRCEAVWEQIPTSIIAELSNSSNRPRPARESIDDQRGTPSGTSSDYPTDVCNLIIGNNQTAVTAAVARAKQLGYHCVVAGDIETANQAEQVAQRLVGQLKELNELNELSQMSHLKTMGDQRSFAPMTCIVSGGEPTVNLCPSPGRGGRNQQLILAAMNECLKTGFQPSGQFAILSGGTDGEDGNVPVAGGCFDHRVLDSICDPNTRRIQPAIARRIQRHLETNDSYPLLDELGCILSTGATRTNVCDLRIVVSRHRSDDAS